MATKKLSELSTTELTKTQKTLKQILGAYAGILIIFAIALILLFIRKQNTVAFPLSIVFFSSIIIMFISKKQLNDIKTELEKRSDNNDNLI
jgi:L-cystine uptake protein TcyP (sodium:dicarboxylate symporter family)